MTPRTDRSKPAVLSNLLIFGSFSTSLWAIMLIFTVALTVCNLLSLFGVGLTTDEGLYMPLIKQMAIGRNIYLTFVDHQAPGIALIGVPFVWIFGSTVLAAKVHSFFFCLLFICAVAYLGWAFTRSRKSAALAAALAGYFAAAYAIRVGVNVSSLSAILTTLGLACAIRQSDKLQLAVAGGLAVGMAIITKPSVVIELPALLWIVYLFNQSWRRTLLFLVACLAVIALVCLYFAVLGTLNEMLYIAIAVNFVYTGVASAAANTSPLYSAIQERLIFFRTVFLPETLPYLSALILGAAASLVWLLRRRRTALLTALALWCILAFLDSAVGVGLHMRYFFHVFAPLAVLFVLAWETALRRRLMQVAFVAAGLLLAIPLLRPLSYSYILPNGKQTSQRSDYEKSISFLSSQLNQDDCLLNWSELTSIFYFTDYRSCSRVIHPGNMMIEQATDIYQMRRQYLHDILTTRPKMMAVGGPWGFFPQLRQLTDHHLGPQVFYDDVTQMSFHTMDWSSYSEGSGNINGEINLMGYDVWPGRNVKRGGEIEIVLYWETVKHPAGDYQGFVQLISSDYKSKIVSVDLLPTEPYWPTSQWAKPGEVVVGRPYKLKIPPDLPAGEYALVTGMYRFGQDGQPQGLLHINRATNQTVPFLSLGKVAVSN
jgi:4-amino-4-deoxy-L-arabinose transferase-like glycosyltransferase